MTAVIRTEKLTRDFGKTRAVDSLDLEVEAGEVFGLLGPNGAGKTTTVGMLTTTVRPTSGTAVVDGHSITKEPGLVRRSVGIVFQELSLDGMLTGRENLELSGQLYGVARAERRRRIAELLELVDLSARADSQVKTYSGGMKRRLELARGLLHRPRVLFMDEPTLGLDPQSREVIWQYIAAMAEAEGTTIVLTTHYMEEAERMCDRIAIIDRGRIIREGTPEALTTALGGDVVRVRAARIDEAALRALPFVSKLQLEPGGATIAMERASVNLPALLAALGPIDAIEVRRPTLNDVFLASTGRHIRDEAATGTWLDDAMRLVVQGDRR
ncbi:MAG: ATP-binding cassette domain-containing protein [Deltaproteobacteria bacterium]|nr:ATP-binding cassette domain-containing protein [Deltaproteobacteria bacterium]